jgi:hypothetical protein
MSKLHGLNLALSLALAAALAPLAWGQAQDELSKQPKSKPPANSQRSPSQTSGAEASASAKSSAQASAEANAAGIQAGTRIDAELEASLDTKTAKPGDQVAARVVHNVKQHGRTVIRKGDQLLGQVTSVSAAASGSANAGSALNVTFDRLVEGSSVMQLNTVVHAILPPAAQQPMAGPTAEPEPMGGPAPSGGGSRGGLLGGAAGGLGSTVNSTLNSTVDTAGSAAQGAGAAIGAASNTTVGANAGVGLATPIRSIHVDSALSAQNQTTVGSTVSTRHGDLRLESGTRLEFRVAGSTQGSKQ